MFKHKPQLKRITRAIAWLLVMTLVANIINSFVAPKPAQAVDANDYMYLFWDGNCAAPPSGWSVVSDADGEAFYDATNGGLFVRGNTSFARNAGGSLTHTHDATVTTTGVTGTSYRKNPSGTEMASNTHTHTGNSASVNSISSLPAYKTLCVIRYDNGIPNGDAAIPDGAIAIFDAAPPAGWSDYSATFGANFIRGNSSAGNTGGSNTHQGTQHTVSNITIGAVNTSGAYRYGTTGSAAATTTHTHTGTSNTTSNTPDTQPPYIEVYLGKKSSNGPIPNGMIAMFDDTDSSVGFSVAGWTRLSDSGGDFYQRLPKVTGAYGSPSGAASHTHATVNHTSAAGSGALANSATPAQTAISETHTHSLGITLNGTNTNIPPYTDVVIAKKQTVTTALTTDQAAYPNIGDTITVDATFNNYHASTNLANTKIDYVFFIDANANGRPDAGETYITNNCAGSGAWASGNYTHQTTGVNVVFGGNTNDQWQCANNNFPDNTTYTLWSRWWDGTSYAYNIYYDKGSVTFTSIPTLTEILFMALVGCMVFLGYKQGIIKLNFGKKEKRKNLPNS